MTNAYSPKLDTITLTKLVTLSVELFEKQQGKLPEDIKKNMMATRYAYAYLQNNAYGVWGAVATLHTVGSTAWCDHIVEPFISRNFSLAA